MEKLKDNNYPSRGCDRFEENNLEKRKEKEKEIEEIYSRDTIELELNFADIDRSIDRTFLTADPEITEGRDSCWSIIGKATGDVRCRIRSWISV